MPVTRWTYLIGCFAISGFPFFAGFFSKDEVLWFAWSNQSVLAQYGGLNNILYVLAVATAGLTAFYMFRSYFMTFEGECRADDETKAHIHESPPLMTLPLVVLAFLATFAGFVGLPHFLFPDIPIWIDGHGFLYQVIGQGEALFMNRFNSEAWAGVGMGIAVTVALSGSGLAWMMYGGPSELPAQLKSALGRLHTLIDNKYYVDEIYEATIIRGVRWMGLVCHRVIDVFIIDQILVQGTAYVASFLGAVLKQFQNGDVQRYAAYIIVALGLIFLLLTV
jgi:NADH-quinone oxidoreductase subunit L